MMNLLCELFSPSHSAHVSLTPFTFVQQDQSINVSESKPLPLVLLFLFSLSTCRFGGGKGEKFKSSSIKLNFTSFLSSQNHLILTYTQEGHNSSKDLKILNNWLLRDWAAHLAKRVHTRKLHVCVNLIMFHVIIFRFSYFHDYGNMKVFIVFNG